MKKSPIHNPDLHLDEETHTYTLKGFDEPLTSATTFIGKFFAPFNAPKIAKDLVENNTKYANYTVPELLKEWNQTGVHGTKVHNEIENWIIDRDDSKLTEPKAKVAVNWIKNTFDLDTHILYPEVKVVSRRWKISGTIDLLAYNPERDLYIIGDWKTNKKITTRGFRGKTGIKPPTYTIEDCKYNLYSLQMSLYRYIIEEESDLSIKRQVLVHLQNEETVYYTPYYYDTIVEMLNYHKQNK